MAHFRFRDHRQALCHGSVINDHVRARADLEDALRRIRLRGGLFPWAVDAWVAPVPVLRALSETDAAQAVADQALTAATAAASRRRIGGAIRVRALLEEGKPGVELRQAADTLATSPAVRWRAQACVDFGAAMRRDGHAVSARPILRDGMELAHRCGAIPLADRGIRRAARRRRAAPTSGRHRRPDALTASERRFAAGRRRVQ